MQHIVHVYGDTVCARDWCVDGVFDFARFYYVLGGEAVYSGEDGTYPLRRGSLYVFPCNTPYRITHNPENPFRVTWLHIGIFASRNSRPAEIPIGEGTLAYHLLKGLACSMNESQAAVEKLFDILMDTLGSELSRVAISDAKLSALVNRIGLEPGRPYTNKRLAGMLGYSEKHFIRYFKRHMGILPHQYVTALRMGFAVKHLIAGRSVKETADLLGYSSACNFSRDFKRHYRLNPTQYISGYSYRP